MVTTLFLIRHGETEGAETRRYKGMIDVPLSENGIRQMERIAKYLIRDIVPPTHPSPSRGEGKGGGESHANKLSSVYCSDLSRAIKSAEIIAELHGLSPVVIPELRERNFGIWEGMSFDEIRERYPKEFDAWANNPLQFSPVDGESTIELRDRAISALEKIIDAHNNEGIAIVAHGGVNRVLLCHTMGIPLENIFRIEQDFAAVNIIEFHDKYPVVKLLNGGCIG